MLYYSHIAFSWWPLVLDSIMFITKFLDYYIRLLAPIIVIFYSEFQIDHVAGFQ